MVDDSSALDAGMGVGGGRGGEHIGGRVVVGFEIGFCGSPSSW